MQIICGCGMEVRALVGDWAAEVGVGGGVEQQVEGGWVGGRAVDGLVGDRVHRPETRQKG